MSEDEFGPDAEPSPYTMFRACCFGNMEFVKRGLSAGVSATVIKFEGYSSTVDWQFYTKADSGGTIAIRTTSGLAAAAMAGCTELISLLLEHKCDVNAVLVEGTSEAIYAAVAGKSAEILRMLLEAGALLTPPMGRKAGASVSEHLHPLCVAFADDMEECLCVLLEYASEELLQAKVGYYEETWLHVAASNGHVNALQNLLSLGKISPHARDSYGRTPFMSSITYDEDKSGCDAVLALVDPTCLLDVTTEGDTVLHVLASKIPHIDPYISGDERVSRVQAAADVVAQKIASYNYSEELLLEHLWAKGLYNRTPLHIAAEYDNAPFVLAISQFVSPDMLPLEVVANIGGTPLCTACTYSKVTTARILLELGAYPNHTGSGSAREMPLFLALEEQSYGTSLYQKAPKYAEFVGLLAAYGADLAPQDEKGNTILHLACAAKRDVPAAMLVRAGASLLTPNHKGLTPLAHMRVSSRPDRAWGLPSHLEIIELIASQNVPADCNWQRRKHAVEAWQDASTS
jgi:hypothetical protein